MKNDEMTLGHTEGQKTELPAVSVKHAELPGIDTHPGDVGVDDGHTDILSRVELPANESPATEMINTAKSWNNHRDEILSIYILFLFLLVTLLLPFIIKL